MSLRQFLSGSHKAGHAVYIGLALVVALVGSLLISGCSSSSKEDYKQEVQACIDEYNEAYNTYTTRVIQELGAIDAEKPLTAEDIAKIHEINDELESKATTALDKMAALKAPSGYEDVQEKVVAYVDAMKTIGLPSIVGPLNALEEGEMLSNFSSADGKPSEQKQAVLKRANADFVEALKKIDINLDTDTSHSEETTGA